jgi:hypothetical protein
MTVSYENRCIYYIYKHGDQRTFATPTTPSIEWAESLHRQGYTIAKVEFVIPATADYAASGTVVPDAATCPHGRGRHEQCEACGGF